MTRKSDWLIEYYSKIGNKFKIDTHLARQYCGYDMGWLVDNKDQIFSIQWKVAPIQDSFTNKETIVNAVRTIPRRHFGIIDGPIRFYMGDLLICGIPCASSKITFKELID